MKKLIQLAFVLAVGCFFSCKKDSYNTPSPQIKDAKAKSFKLNRNLSSTDSTQNLDGTVAVGPNDPMFGDQYAH